MIEAIVFVVVVVLIFIYDAGFGYNSPENQKKRDEKFDAAIARHHEALQQKVQDGPTVVLSKWTGTLVHHNRTEHWHNGKLHGNSVPAVVFCDGVQYWYFEGKYLGWTKGKNSAPPQEYVDYFMTQVKA